jgi:GLTT repeat (6 copies)
MTTQRWFQKETAQIKRKALIGLPAIGLPAIGLPAIGLPAIGRSAIGRSASSKPKTSELGALAARLRPHELIAMLTHHYTRVRARSMPRIKTTLSVNTPSGKAAVTISFG